MNVEYINPFIESVYDLFTTMLGCEAKRGEIDVVDTTGDVRDIVALVGLSGPASGTLSMSFPVNTAMAIASRMLGMDVKIVDNTVSDAVAEVVNIVGGGAKAKLVDGNHEPIELSLPTVVRGNSYTVDYPSRSVWLEVPFTSDLGEFSIRVTFQKKNGK